MSVEEQFKALIDTVRAYNPAADFGAIERAYRFAAEAHKEQLRKDGSPYITHPLATAQIIAEELHVDSESIEACLLHDVIEDTGVSHEDVAREFSPTVADLVEGVTKLTRISYTSKEDEQMENLRKMLIAMSKDIRVILIKISDRLHNMRTMEYQTPDKQRKKSTETMEIYAPIAHRLGIQKIKWELEDLSLKYLDPVGYREIQHTVDAKKADMAPFMEHLEKHISERLDEMHIHHVIYSRVKHYYSVYRKMYRQNLPVDEIFDLFAFRVIVDNVGDCYNVLGVIHDLYHPILGKFKDYIGSPKPNGYQSLHTTVMGENAVPFEVQIRTREMHEVAEYGVAAHWKYKSDGQGAGSESKYEWIRRLLENQEGTDAEEFISSLKVDMFSDEVFVFTPGGDIRSLPTGATPIDFAYNIHSAVGNRMVGAKVNGRLVPYETELKNGDVVEVLTSKAAKGPSRDWIAMAKSNEARSKIRQWFKKERREENIQNGRASLESEMKHQGFNPKQCLTEENMPVLLKKVAFNSLDELCAAIGYGGFTALKAVNRMREDLKALTKQPESTVAEEPSAAAESVPRKQSKGVEGVIVEGLDHCLVKFAKCCTPVPGDAITGFITRGAGVSIHRCDCPNAAQEHLSEAEKGRWVSVSWSSVLKESYPTSLEISAKDRPNLILDVSAVLSAAKLRVDALSGRTTPDNIFILHVDIDVKDSEQLKTVMNKIMQISGVTDVVRPIQ